MNDRSFVPLPPLFASADLRRLFPDKATLRSAGLIIDVLHSTDEDGTEEHYGDPDSSRSDLSETEILARRIRDIESLHSISSGLTHDLNNLFQVATSALSLITLRLEQGRVDDALRLISKAEMALQRGGAIVERLTALPVLPVSHRSPLDVNRSVLGLVDLMRVLTGVTIDVELGLTSEDTTVLCDALEFENAILNLVANARNAICGAGCITIATSRQLLPVTEQDATMRACVVLTVTDDGQGMEPDIAARACDPFFSAATSGNRTGLGLSTVRRLLNRIGGRIAIESDAGVGTTIALIIPAAHTVDVCHA